MNDRKTYKEGYTKKVVGDNCFRKTRMINGKYEYIKLLSCINNKIQVVRFQQ